MRGPVKEEHETKIKQRESQDLHRFILVRRLLYGEDNCDPIEAVVGGLSRVGCGGVLRIRWWGTCSDVDFN